MAGVTKKSPVAEIFDSMDYGPAPESQNEANKWLDNHKRKFGHFVNGKWYEPEGREYYTSKAPMNHSVLAETIQGMFYTVTIFFEKFSRGLFSSTKSTCPSYKPRILTLTLISTYMDFLKCVGVNS